MHSLPKGGSPLSCPHCLPSSFCKILYPLPKRGRCFLQTGIRKRTIFFLKSSLNQEEPSGVARPRCSDGTESRLACPALASYHSLLLDWFSATFTLSLKNRFWVSQQKTRPPLPSIFHYSFHFCQILCPLSSGVPLVGVMSVPRRNWDTDKMNQYMLY